MGSISYQRIVCWGDSQTVGARTYGCYPLYLVMTLEASTRYRWSTSNLATNGHTVRDLWFRVPHELVGIRDCFQACILIGANDVAAGTDPDLFDAYYRQILTTLEIGGWRVAHCGEIPPIWPDGHAFVDRSAQSRRDEYNARLHALVDDSRIARLVEFRDLDPECFVDPLHFSERGNRSVADAFADSIRQF